MSLLASNNEPKRKYKRNSYIEWRESEIKKILLFFGYHDSVGEQKEIDLKSVFGFEKYNTSNSLFRSFCTHFYRTFSEIYGVKIGRNGEGNGMMFSITFVENGIYLVKRIQ